MSEKTEYLDILDLTLICVNIAAKTEKYAKC